MVRAADWRVAEAAGAYHGSADDRRDGFLHFSDAAQIRASAAKHRAGEPDLLLVAVEAAALGEALRWEPASGGGPRPVPASLWRLAAFGGADGGAAAARRRWRPCLPGEIRAEPCPAAGPARSSGRRRPPPRRRQASPGPANAPRSPCRARPRPAAPRSHRARAAPHRHGGRPPRCNHPGPGQQPVEHERRQLGGGGETQSNAAIGP